MIKKIFLITFIISLLFSVLSINLLLKHDEKLKGDAISGKVEDGKYYIMNDDLDFIEVKEEVYRYNYFLWVFSITFGLVTGISMIGTIYLWIFKPTVNRIID